MKQHITVEQLNELSEKGKDRLREWWKGNYEYKDAPHSFQSEDPYCGVEYSKQPYLSIGQMIEFLDEHVENLEIRGRRMNTTFLVDIPDNTMIWDISGGDWNENEDEVELIDALWEAVKEVLEK